MHILVWCLMKIKGLKYWLKCRSVLTMWSFVLTSFSISTIFYYLVVISCHILFCLLYSSVLKMLSVMPSRMQPWCTFLRSTDLLLKEQMKTWDRSLVLSCKAERERRGGCGPAITQVSEDGLTITLLPAMEHTYPCSLGHFPFLTFISRTWRTAELCHVLKLYESKTHLTFVHAV